MALTEADVIEALRPVHDPELHRSIVDLGMVRDVVVDGDARGKGVGAALNRFALEVAESLGARSVDLTSRPTREVANRLYKRLGFVQRDTNVYRHRGDA